MTCSPSRRITDAVRHLSRPCVLAFALVAGALFFSAPSARATLNNGEPAIDILGEFNSPSSDTTADYVKPCVNNGASSLGFYESLTSVVESPSGIIDATNNRLFVSDLANHRVLVFTLNTSNQISSKTAANVLGQQDFISCQANQGGNTGQSTLYDPGGMDFDATNNRLFVADTGNSRVLVFNTSSITNGMNASYELGQPSFTTSGGYTTQAGLSAPVDVKYDSVNSRLFVAEYSNNRVTVFNVAPGSIANDENASYELGHASGGTAFTTATSGLTQSTMHGPNNLAYDSADTLLYVADVNNNRVLVFNVATGTIANGENASDILGEANYTTATAHTTQAGLSGPQGLAYDATNNRLFVSEYNNNRVTVFSTANVINDENASDVLGQYNSSTMADNPADYVKSCVNDGASPIGLVNPLASVIDPTNHWLFVADPGNNRVLVFTLSSSNVLTSKTPTYVLGQPDFTTCSGGSQTQSTFDDPRALAVDPANQLLYVSDSENGRIMIFSTASMSNSMNASNVLGATDFVGGCTGCTSQATMNATVGVAVDSAHSLVYVTDGNDKRVLAFPTPVTNGENASYVLGQTNFTNTGTGLTQSTLNSPLDLAYDSGDQLLFVADNSNNRVLAFSTNSLTNGENASYVLGQANFTSNSGTNNQSTLGSGADYVTFDATNARLFVSSNDRILVFSTSGIANGENASYQLGPSSFTAGFSAGTTQSQFNDAAGMAFDATNELLYVSDYFNNRVMIFNVAPGTIANGENATDLLGHYTSATSTTTVNWTQNDPNNGPDNLGFDQPADVAIDPVNHYMYVADSMNNRVLVYALSTSNTLNTSSGGHTASYVLGQPNFYTSAAATTQAGMNTPQSVAFDSVNNRLFVADTKNGRVLVFNTSSLSNGMNASYELGIPSGGGAFTTSCFNSCTSSQSTVDYPLGLAYDSANTRLFVADTGANRVMVFNVATGTIANGENAINELGHAAGGTAYTNVTNGVTTVKMHAPVGVAYDSENSRLFVSDQDNSRVMVFNVASNPFTNGVAASFFLGQSNSTNNAAATTQAGMDLPDNLSYDAPNNRLFVADNINKRVLVYNAGPSVIATGMNASYVIGQVSFTTNNANSPTQSGLVLDQPINNSLSCAHYDPATNLLYVCDTDNHRVLTFSTSNAGQVLNDESAQYVLGQANFTSGTTNQGGATGQSTLAGAVGGFYDSTNTQEYVVDQNNNRIMIFNAAPASIANGENASDELGQYTTPGGATNLWTANGPNNGPTALGMYLPRGVALDAVHHYLYVSDSSNNRVMVYALNTDNSLSTSSGGHTASYVIGASSLQGANAGGTTTQSTLAYPAGIAVDTANQRLFVADNQNNRVMVFSTASLSNGMNASYVLGQTSFTAGQANQGATVAQSTLFQPSDVVYDAVNSRLFVADLVNNRVLAFNVATGTIANGENASYELGQASGGTAFTTGTANQGGMTAQNTLSGPANVAYDAVNSRLFVADAGNHRVLAFNVATGTIANGENAANVLGQSNFTNNTAATTQSGMSNPSGLSYDPNNNRLFSLDEADPRVVVYNVAPSVITNGENASYVLGCSTFAGCSYSLSQSGLTLGLSNPASAVLYDPGSGRVFVTDTYNNRVMIFQGSYMGNYQWTPGYD